MFKGAVRILDVTKRLRVDTSPASVQTHGMGARRTISQSAKTGCNGARAHRHQRLEAIQILRSGHGLR